MKRVPWEMMDLANFGVSYRMFPDCWKASRTVFLPKRTSDETTVAYRPLSLINNMGKVAERLVANRIIQELEDNNGLH